MGARKTSCGVSSPSPSQSLMDVVFPRWRKPHWWSRSVCEALNKTPEALAKTLGGGGVEMSVSETLEALNTPHLLLLTDSEQRKFHLKYSRDKT